MENFFSKNAPGLAQSLATFYEQETWAQKELLSGIDEVGRGCLAGPVVACALVLKPGSFHPLLKDSKILTEKQRLTVAPWIEDHSWYGLGIIDQTQIDRHNIYQATLKAMNRAYYQLACHPNLPQLPRMIIVDAMPLKLAIGNPHILSCTQAESKSISVAAASIIAKVMRDALMERAEKSFPGYQFESNKGYAAAVHRAALHTQQMSLIHRVTFLGSLQGAADHENRGSQSSLFR